MVHPDHETRIGAHRIFSVVLVPSSVFPRPSSSITESNKAFDLPRTLSRTVSVFSSSAALFEKLKMEKFSSRENVSQDGKENGANEEEPRNTDNGMLNRLKSSYTRVYSMKTATAPVTTDGNSVSYLNKETVSFWQCLTLLDIHTYYIIGLASFRLSWLAIQSWYSFLLLRVTCFVSDDNRSRELYPQIHVI